MILEDLYHYLNKVNNQLRTISFSNNENKIISYKELEEDIDIERMRNFKFILDLPFITFNYDGHENKFFAGIKDVNKINVLDYVYNISKNTKVDIDDFYKSIEHAIHILVELKYHLQAMLAFYSVDGAGLLCTDLFKSKFGQVAQINENFILHGIIPQNIVQDFLEQLNLKGKKDIGALTIATKEHTNDYVYYMFTVYNNDLVPVNTIYSNLKIDFPNKIQIIFTPNIKKIILKTLVQIEDVYKYTHNSMNQLHGVF